MEKKKKLARKMPSFTHSWIDNGLKFFTFNYKKSNLSFSSGRWNASKHRTFGSTEACPVFARIQVRTAATGHRKQHQPASLLVQHVRLLRQQVQLHQQHLTTAATGRRGRRRRTATCSSGNLNLQVFKFDFKLTNSTLWGCDNTKGKNSRKSK